MEDQQMIQYDLEVQYRQVQIQTLTKIQQTLMVLVDRILQNLLATRLPLAREIQVARLQIPMTTTTLL